MIKTALVAMTVLGCDCDAKMCQLVADTPATYATVADCEAALKKRVVTTGNQDFPLVTGYCSVRSPDQPVMVAGTPAAKAAEAAAVAPTLTPAPERRRLLAGMLDGGKSVLSGGKSVLYRTAGGYTLVRDRLGDAASGTAAAAKRLRTSFVQKVASAFLIQRLGTTRQLSLAASLNRFLNGGSSRLTLSPPSPRRRDRTSR